MTDISQLIDSGPTDDNGRPLPQIVAGVIDHAPAHTTDLLDVTIGSFDDDTHDWSFSYRWTPRVDSAGAYVAPSAGDTCVVIFDNDGAGWVPVYWPA
jgi:hypothetical protein